MRQYRGIVFLGKCNLECWYCDKPNYDVDQEKVIVSMENIFNRFDKDKTCVRVECRGEITLYGKIMEYLIDKAESGYIIEILTNGLLLKEVLGERKSVRSVISLDGHTKRMNYFRHLNTEQVNVILDNIFYYNAEIQCVFLGQTMDQMNEFISYLLEKNFNQRLHIFPCSISGKLVSDIIDYDFLTKGDFLPPREYFDRWKYVMENKNRNFTCDYFVNGYTYYIYNDEIQMVKCDGTPECNDFMHIFGEERTYESYPCCQCINHNEYNNIREIVKGGE